MSVSVLSLRSSYAGTEYPPLPDSSLSAGNTELSQKLAEIAQTFVDSVASVATTLQTSIGTDAGSTYGSATTPASTILTPNHRSFDRDSTSGALTHGSYGTLPDDLLSSNSNISVAGPVGGSLLTPSQIKKLVKAGSEVLLPRCQIYTEDKFLYRSGFRRVGLGHPDAWIQRQLRSNDFWNYLEAPSGPSAILKHKVASYANAAVTEIGADLHAAAWTRLRALQGGDDLQSAVSSDASQSLLSTIATEPVALSLAGDPQLEAPMLEWPDPPLSNENEDDRDDLHPDAEPEYKDGDGDALEIDNND